MICFVDRRVLVVDDVWTRRNIVTVAGRIDAAGGMPETCVLHYKPALFASRPIPTYYAAVTDAFIVHPWKLIAILKQPASGIANPIHFDLFGVAINA